jgi:exopolysaccharide biosynthesis polyprenyl glycosylphosphotransferase
MTTTTHVPVVAANVASSLGTLERAPLTEVPWPHVRQPGRRALATITVSIDLVAALACAATVHLATGALRPAVLVTVPLAWVLLLCCCGGYAPVPGRSAGDRGRVALRAGAGLGVAAWMTAALAPGLLDTSGTTTAAGVLVLMASLTTSAFAVRLMGLGSSANAPRVVVLGDRGSVEDVLHELRRPRRIGQPSFQPAAVCLASGAEPSARLHGLPALPGTDHLTAAVLDHRADAVIVTPGPWADSDELRRIGWQLQGSGTQMLLSSGLLDVTQERLTLTAARGLRLLHVRPAPLTGPARLLKNAVDRMVAALLLLFLAPALGVLALMIRRDSPGQAFFRQERVGRQGRLFTMYKLRTMRNDADLEVDTLHQANESDSDGVLFKIRSDPRITAIGAILRKYSLDELPQLINVLRGEMSLVGPRPALPSEVQQYTNDLRRRLVVRPGMTGLWQVSGRSDLSWEDTVRLDLQYVDNWSLSLDAQIALRTAGAVLGHRGAY